MTDKIIVLCEYCGKEVLRYPYQIRDCKHSFCSATCHYAFMVGKICGANSPTWKGGLITKVCLFCGIEFQTRHDRPGKYCSQSCHDKARMTRQYFNCEECGKQYWRLLCQIKQRGGTRFCSIKCASVWSSKHRSGKNSPMWKGGKSLRPSESALSESKYYQTRQRLISSCEINDLTKVDWQEVLQTFNYRCAYCHKESNHMEKDHIIPLSRGGNHTKSNIVPACRSCNSRKHDKTLLEYVVYLGGA